MRLNMQNICANWWLKQTLQTYKFDSAGLIEAFSLLTCSPSDGLKSAFLFCMFKPTPNKFTGETCGFPSGAE